MKKLVLVLIISLFALLITGCIDRSAGRGTPLPTGQGAVFSPEMTDTPTPVPPTRTLAPLLLFTPAPETPQPPAPTPTAFTSPAASTPLMAAPTVIESGFNLLIPTAVPTDAVTIYKAMIVIQSNAAILTEAARLVAQGEVSNAPAAVDLFTISALIETVDSELGSIQPVPVLKDSWQQVVRDHHQVSGILRRWLNNDIGAQQVETEMAPINADLETTISQAEQSLGSAYGFPPNVLSIQRRQILQASLAILNTPTPTLSP